jgi:hypothetical protein
MGKKKLFDTGTETTKIIVNTKTLSDERTSALECGVTKKWTKTHPDTGHAPIYGPKNG